MIMLLVFLLLTTNIRKIIFHVYFLILISTDVIDVLSPCPMLAETIKKNVDSAADCQSMDTLVRPWPLLTVSLHFVKYLGLNK